MSRTGFRLSLAEDKRDHAYYRDQGWFRSDYYYPTRLGPFMKAAGALFDRVAARLYPQAEGSKPSAVRAGMPGTARRADGEDPRPA